jgi:hypothetical protein
VTEQDLQNVLLWIFPGIRTHLHLLTEENVSVSNSDEAGVHENVSISPTTRHDAPD